MNRHPLWATAEVSGPSSTDVASQESLSLACSLLYSETVSLPTGSGSPKALSGNLSQLCIQILN